MNNSLFAPGSPLGNAFNDIFKTAASDVQTNKLVDVAMPIQPVPDNKPTSSDVA